MLNASVLREWNGSGTTVRTLTNDHHFAGSIQSHFTGAWSAVAALVTTKVVIYTFTS